MFKCYLRPGRLAVLERWLPYTVGVCVCVCSCACAHVCVHVCVYPFSASNPITNLRQVHCVARCDGMWMDLAIFGRFWRYTSTCVAMVIEHRCKVTHLHKSTGRSRIYVPWNFPNQDSQKSVSRGGKCPIPKQ